MKKILYTMAFTLLFGLSACQDTFLDLDPLDQKTDVVYFKTPAHFKEYATGFYGQLIGWQSRYGHIYSHMDAATDLSAYFAQSSDVGTGQIMVGTKDDRWKNSYENIRTVNILLERALEYSGSQSDIAQFVSEAYFFRAYTYFYLLKFFGGVPIVTKVLNTDSPELYGARHSRYEVIDRILSDLDNAIAGLPLEQNISGADKGRVSQWAAKAFKARVLLYEATWRKNNGTKTDYEGSAGPSSDQVNSFLEEAISLSDEVMKKGGYVLWNYNTQLENLSSRYLFNLEDAGSNPAGLTKQTNKEFILYGVYDNVLRPGAINLSWTVWQMYPSRKLIDMFLCTDGLPADKSDKFMGYKNVGDEFKNRDYRLEAYIGSPSPTMNLNGGTSGYGNQKFATYNYGSYRKDKEESANYPVLRLAEVYLIYAEALIERYGQITNAQLNESVNKLRERAGVKGLTTEMAVLHGLDMKEEIRRERAVELFMEGHRFDDLKRWGIAEAALNESRCGMVVGDASYPTVFVDDEGNATSRYAKNTYVWGEEKVETAKGKLSCVVISSKSNHYFSKTHYLWPLPSGQIAKNPSLIQNPGYK
ncbi:RagB/SusD family nutrient uptake outer membrane protein [Dysgonomonas sp. 511]|uniref:RagB/SusD family nutrient uptake outer membrane protein n=1 Tax=Dysgonomonas sp. 511 TaxID=2302930 RepID=UPI0013D0C546|nr:RagB/SusD family nutrient uptake outer membrane protein [Dysgonomonas sp. 511]NDV77575.1 RagB/SusD family nutrient uptake outer membrane protein [Dysgonomonas sp. 511]